MNIWSILKISPTDDPKRVRKAYAAQLKTIHPEDDPKIFEELREAYEIALDETKSSDRQPKTTDLAPSLNTTTITIPKLKFTEAEEQTPHRPPSLNTTPITIPKLKFPEVEEQTPLRLVDTINVMMRELFEGDSVKVFKNWIKEGVFIDLELSLAFQNALIEEFLILSKMSVNFPKLLFFQAYIKFNWQDLLIRTSDSRHSSFEKIVKLHNLFSQIELLHSDSSDLTQAILLDDMDLAKAALEAGADLKHKDSSNRSILLLAVLFAGVDLLTFLVSLIDLQDEVDALNVAITTKEHEKVKSIVENGFDLSLPPPEDKQLPLVTAICSHNLESVKYLLEQGADPNQKMGESTILSEAVLRQSPAISLLLEAGAQPEDSCGLAINVAFEYSLYHSAEQLIRKLDLTIPENQMRNQIGNRTGESMGYVSFGDDVTILDGIPASFPIVQISDLVELFQAAYRGDLEALKHHIEQGVDVNMISEPHRLNALYCACWQGHHDCVRYLLEKGANPNQVIHTGLGPLHVAIQHGHNVLIDILISAGADVNLVVAIHHYSPQYSPLFIAVKYQNKEAIDTLFKHGAPDIHTQILHSALMAAVYNGDLQTTQDLVRQGSDIKQVYRFRDFTLLYIAARYHRTEVLKYLLTLSLHPDWEAETGTGTGDMPWYEGKDIPLTPLAAAVVNGDVGGVKALLDAGADPNRLSNGIPPLHFAKTHFESVVYLAKENPFHEIIDLLLEQGADIDGKSADGDTFFIKTVRHKLKDTMQYLIDLGADTRIKDKEGKFVTRL